MQNFGGQTMLPPTTQRGFAQELEIATSSVFWQNDFRSVPQSHSLAVF